MLKQSIEMEEEDAWRPAIILRMFLRNPKWPSSSSSYRRDTTKKHHTLLLLVESTAISKLVILF